VKTLVSVIIPNYNGSLLIRRCLDSVFSQDGEFELETIVIDDGSTDNSVDIVCSYPRTVILIQQSNKGPATARNKGIEKASGKYLAFLDADDYWLPGFLEHTVKFLESNPRAIAVSVGQIHKIPCKSDQIIPEILVKDSRTFHEPILIDDFFSFWAEHNHVCTGSVLMRDEIVKQSGGQRSDLKITEDLEFWLYLATFGNWGFIPKILYVSDGGIVTKNKGWLKKNMIRWRSAPSLRNWERRIKERFNEPLSEGYLLSIGRIAGNLAYSMIMSSRDDLARETIVDQKKYLVRSSMMLLMKACSTTPFLWDMFCTLLRLRESNRKL